MHQLIGKQKKITIYLILLIILSTINNRFLESQKIHFTNINKIDVVGLSNNNNLQIADNLKELLFKNIFFINRKEINETISQYNIVENYSVKKIYPTRINIKIEPTKFVVRILDEDKFLVGANGKLIKNEIISQKLPLLEGRFNSVKFLEFKRIIENSQFKFIDFKSIFFYPSYRWDILTMDDILIKLPEKDLPETLRVAYKILKNDQFKSNRVIDLRISNRIVSQK